MVRLASVLALVTAPCAAISPHNERISPHSEAYLLGLAEPPSRAPDLAAYLVVTAQMSFDKARAHCRGLGRDLASVSSKDQWDAILAADQAVGRRRHHFFWVGLELRAGVWTNVDGSLPFVKWGPGQPNGGAQTDKCINVAIWPKGRGYGMNDNKCSALAGAVCAPRQAAGHSTLAPAQNTLSRDAQGRICPIVCHTERSHIKIEYIHRIPRPLGFSLKGHRCGNYAPTFAPTRTPSPFPTPIPTPAPSPFPTPHSWLAWRAVTLLGHKYWYNHKTGESLPRLGITPPSAKDHTIVFAPTTPMPTPNYEGSVDADAAETRTSAPTPTPTAAPTLPPAYLLVTARMGFYQARAHCRGLGRDLASVHTKEQWGAIVAADKAAGRRPHHYFWIGVRRRGMAWANVDGTKPFLTWGPQQPNGGYLDSCVNVAIWHAALVGGQRYALNDNKCTARAGAMCGPPLRGMHAAPLTPQPQPLGRKRSVRRRLQVREKFAVNGAGNAKGACSCVCTWKREVTTRAPSPAPTAHPTPNPTPESGIVDGGWGSWGSWSACSHTCGKHGHMYRKRLCDSPAPSVGLLGGDYCKGKSASTKVCVPKPCPTYGAFLSASMKVDGGWSKFSDWSACTRSCGSGFRVRARSCTAPAPQFGGAQCKGSREDGEKCHTAPCYVRGGWSVYGNWTTCTEPCGPKGGVQARERKCNRPAPAGGAPDCSGGAVDMRKCNTFACIGIGVGIGMSTRLRSSILKRWAAHVGKLKTYLGMGAERSGKNSSLTPAPSPPTPFLTSPPATTPTPPPTPPTPRPTMTWAQLAGGHCVSGGSTMVPGCAEYEDEDGCNGFSSPLPMDVQSCLWKAGPPTAPHAETRGGGDTGRDSGLAPAASAEALQAVKEAVKDGVGAAMAAVAVAGTLPDDIAPADGDDDGSDSALAAAANLNS